MEKEFDTVVLAVVEQLFNEFERMALWNAAYHHAMAIGGEPSELKRLANEYARRDQQPLGIPKYSDLRQQAIDAVRHRDSDAFAALIPQVKTRAAAWKAFPDSGAL